MRHPSSPRVRLRSALFSSFALLLLAVPSRAQGKDPMPISAPVAASAQVCQAFQIRAGTVQDIRVPASPAGEFLVDVWMGSRLETLQLHPHDVRARGFTLQVDDGNSIRVAPTPAPVTFQGEIVGCAGSAVAVTVSGGQMRGIAIDDRGLWGIQPLRDADPSARAVAHVVYDSADNWNQPFHCGVLGANQPGPSTPVQGTDVLSQAEIACEVDYLHYRRFNNVTLAQNDVTGVINAMDVIYRRDCEITYLITTILVRTASDPYSTTDAGTLLSQFGSWWNANQGSVQRDLAHLFTGRSLNGSTIGIAYLGVVCNRGSAYGLVETMYAGTGTNFTYRVGLSAHEIGHNWNAQHCNASNDCRIMCSGLGGCSGNVSSFSVGEQNQIVSFKNSRTCLTTQFQAPAMISMTPSSVQAFRPSQVLVNGLRLSGTNQVQVGSQTGTFGVYVLSDTQARFTPPQPSALGVQQVRLINPAGTSNPLSLTYTATSPCQLAAPSAAIGGQPAVFEFGGQPGDAWFLIASLSSATAPLQGQQVLASFSTLSLGSLDSVGIGSFTVPVPLGILSGLTIYSQVLEADMTTLSLVSASGVGSTLIFL